MEKRNVILTFDRRIEEMHAAFHKLRHGQVGRTPDWERLEKDLLTFSARKIRDVELTKHLDRVLYKFQNRKKIWLRWVDEVHQGL